MSSSFGMFSLLGKERTSGEKSLLSVHLKHCFQAFVSLR